MTNKTSADASRPLATNGETVAKRTARPSTTQQRRRSGVALSARDIAVIRSVARYRFLTSHQVHALHYPTTSHVNATKRLTELARGGMLSRVFSYPRPKATDQSIGRATAIYFFPQKNQKNVKTFLENAQKSSEWETIEILLKTFNSAGEFSQQYLAHEIGVSEFFLQIEKDCRQENTPELIFWERTSPLSKEAQAILPTQGKHMVIYPDGFFCLKYPRGYAFFFLEYDNDTASLPKYRRKLEGYAQYREGRHFAPLLSHYCKKYLVPVSDPTRAGFRVLTVTPHERRRNSLFLDSLALKAYKFFLFADIHAIADIGATGKAWIRGKEFADIQKQLDALPTETAPTARARFLAEKMPTLAHVSFED